MNELLAGWQVSDERAFKLVQANLHLSAEEIADQEGLEPIEYVTTETYGLDKNE